MFNIEASIERVFDTPDSFDRFVLLLLSYRCFSFVKEDERKAHMLDERKTIARTAVAEITEKKSRFIAHIAPAQTEEEALAFIDEVRTTHRMARHNVYAYVVQAGGRIRYTDDGEPSKTAGMPTLEVIQHAGLSDVVVVVTRYFGGTLLGTGGLVRAYTQATQAAIDASDILVISKCRDITVRISYSIYDRVSYLCEQFGAKIGDVVYADAVLLTLRVLDEGHAQLVFKLQELIRDKGCIEVGERYEAPF